METINKSETVELDNNNLNQSGSCSIDKMLDECVVLKEYLEDQDTEVDLSGLDSFDEINKMLDKYIGSADYDEFLNQQARQDAENLIFSTSFYFNK